MIRNRYLRKVRSKTRAVEPVIAALLLIAIAVAAAVVTYSWVMTMIKGQGTQAQTSIRTEEVTFGQYSAGTATSTLSNINTRKHN